MSSMRGDIVNRVRRLPKPTKASEALQPLFEAVSNGIHAVEDCFKEEAVKKGRLQIVITDGKDTAKISIVVTDNGIGLDSGRYEAFGVTDTPFKITRGGKGIGRLLWLDAFERVDIQSVFRENAATKRRQFSFILRADEQLADEKVENVSNDTPTGTSIRFSGLRGVAYQNRFPVQTATFVKHFGSHFFADFILGNAPSISLSIGGKHFEYPASILELRVRDLGTCKIDTEEFGDLSLASFECRKAASADFDGLHQIHFIANGRTVTTRKIDGLIGVGKIGDGSDNVYHGCVSGAFLDERVNQERTQFNFDESVIDEIAKACGKKIADTVLKKEIDQFDGERLTALDKFVSEYPSFHFEDTKDLLGRVPRNAMKAEQFASALVPIRIRRDIERKRQVQEVVEQLGNESPVGSDFAEAVRKAASEIQAEEQRQLTEYVLRRRMVLEVLDVLLRRIRERDESSEDFHLEGTLHQFICPMRIRGDNPDKIEASDHDLWILDERFCFTRYFASDVPFDQLIEDSRAQDRPDLVIFDRLHGLGVSDEEPLRRVMLVEFKKPGRKDYEERYSPINQVSRYLNELVGGRVESYRGERIRIADDCIFYCYVVADIVGTLDIHTSSWRTTLNGRGRWTELSGKYRGSIEVIEWKDLVGDARMRNRAFIQAAGS